MLEYMRVEKRFLGLAMTNSNVIAATVLAAGVGLSGNTLSEPLKLPHSTEELTAEKASIIIRQADRAVFDWMTAGLTQAFNPNANIIINNRKEPLGLTPDTCKKLSENSRFLVDMDTYKKAQNLLISSGALNPERAATQLKTQSELMDMFFSSAKDIIQDCKTKGINEFKFSEPIIRALDFRL